MLQELSTKTSLAQIGDDIGMDLGTQMVKSYQNANPTDVKCYTVGREIIEKILAQPGCAGLQFFNALNEVGEKTLVYLGVDTEGKPLVEYTVVKPSGQLQHQKGIIADRIKTDDGGGSGWDWLKWIFS